MSLTRTSLIYIFALKIDCLSDLKRSLTNSDHHGSEGIMNSRVKDLLGMLSVICCQSIFGFSFLFSKVGTNISDPFSVLGWRFTVAFIAIAICAVTGLIKIDLKGKDLRPLIMLSIFTPVINYLLETIGISMTTSSESGAMVACLPIACMISASLILRKIPNRTQVLGITVTVAGVLICVFARGFTKDLHMMGNILIIISVFSNSIFTALSEKAKEFSSVEKTFMMLLLGCATFMPLAVIRNAITGSLVEYFTLPFVNKMFLASALYLGIGCSLVAFFLNNTAISIIGTTRTASFGGISTIVSIIAGVVIMKEEFLAIQVAGTVLVLIGAYTANAKAIMNNKETRNQ